MKKSKQLCAGCRDNFYNSTHTSNTGECWSYPSARIKKKKFVPLDMRPPWDIPAETTLSCHRRKGYVAVGKDQVR